jgi:hypothetical protein
MTDSKSFSFTIPIKEKQSSKNLDAKLEAFVAKADYVPERKQSVKYSWEDPSFKDDKKRTFNLKLTPEQLAKLAYISARETADKGWTVSMQQICHEIMIPAIEKRIQKIIEEDEKGN